MNPYLSWAIVFAVAGSLGWYYNSGSKAKGKIPVKTATAAPGKAESPRSGKKQKRKSNKKPAAQLSPPPSTTKEITRSTTEPDSSAVEGYDNDEEIDRKEFAKRFAAVKTGGLAPSSAAAESGSKAHQRRNKKKNNKVNGIPVSHTSTRASSTTGAEADDDLSSTESPKTDTATRGSEDVSDMLDAPAPKASVLRVTGAAGSEPKKQPPKKESFKPAETKKQRQQRLKNEERKQQVKEAEQERRKLLEKQLHMARELERREAKPVTVTPPTTNAWASPTQTLDATTTGSNGITSSIQAPKVTLLDTFDDTNPASNLTQESPATPREWGQSIPTEEEQMQILGVSSESEWTTVSNRKLRKKGGKSDDSVSESGGSETQPISSVPLSTVETEVTVTQTYIPDILRSGEKGHPLDSDWVA